MPLIMVAVVFMATVIGLFVDLNYVYLSELFGYSVSTNLFMLAVYSNKKYCQAIKFSVYGLLSLNIINMFFYTLDYYPLYYDLAIELVLITTIILLIKRDGITTSNRS